MSKIFPALMVIILSIIASFVPAVICADAGEAENHNILFRNGQTIAFVGDSITRDGLHFVGGYGHLVRRGLEANGIFIKQIKAGNGGECSTHMLARIDRIIAQKPDWISLSCGVNDVGINPMQKTSNVPIEKFIEVTTEMVDRIQAAGIPLILLTPTIIGEDPDNLQNKRMEPYVAHILSIAKQRNIPVADMNLAMKKAVQEAGTERTSRLPGEPGQFLRDGVHMNQMGNIVMARAFLAAIGLTEFQQEIGRASCRERV